MLADDFPIGAALEPRARSRALATPSWPRKHFSSLTAGNAMKFGPIHPTEASFNFAGADTIANFARANGIALRGHTLVWHSQNPDWLFRDAAGVDLTPTAENKALMLQRLEDHIRAVVPRYNDVVTAWDVVNEVIDANQPDGLRRTRWYELTGSDYIDVAFRVAREVAPARQAVHQRLQHPRGSQAPGPARRGAGSAGPRRTRGLRRASGARERRAAVSGLATATSVLAFAALGLDNQITEMDISVYTNGTDSLPMIPEATLLQQGYRYRDFFREFRRLKDNISSVTVWGLADDNTWLKNFPIPRLDLPLLFDEDLQAKHAYWGVVDPLQLPVRTQRMSVVKGSPRIDGREDTVWDDDRLHVHRRRRGGLTATFKTLWDAGHVYVLADVRGCDLRTATTGWRSSSTRTTARPRPTRPMTPPTSSSASPSGTATGGTMGTGTAAEASASG